MSKTIAILVVLAIAAVIVLFATGVIDLADKPSDVDPVPTSNGSNGQEPEDGSGGGTLMGSAPENRPELQEYRIEEPVKVLFLVAWPQSFNAYLAQQWESQPNVSIVTWSAPPPPTSGSGPPPGTVMPGAWDGPPDANTLRELEIDVVAIHDLDPALVDDEFWDALYAQAREGSVGVLAMAGQTNGEKMLSHPGLRRLLPVKKARAIEGPEKPGILPGLTPFRVTEEGTRHPATRLVPWPSWSRRIWDSFRLGDRPWGTSFAYPVEEIADGAATLVEVDTRRGPEWPTIIAGPERNGRVLWLGLRDFADPDAYTDGRHLADRRVLIRNMTAWLADQVPESR